MREFDLNGLRLAEFQGSIFEASVDAFSCSSNVFLRRFKLSNLAKNLDKNESAFIDGDVLEALRQIETQFGISDYGNEKFSKESMFWMGYFYRYICYTRDVSTSFVFSLFKYETLNKLYYVYHTQDMKWCLDSLLEVNGLTEDIFDKNKRIKAIIAAEMRKTNLKSDR